MKLTSRDFLNWKTKSVTLVGMAGVGKTRVAYTLRRHQWFHYSADYRIGTRYLDEPILDNIKRQAMQIPFLRDLLRSDSIYIMNNITVDNLDPVTSFLGMLGNPQQGGLSIGEFRRRQELYRQALVAAMRDVPEFIGKAREIYGYQHFVNDTAGSLCELDSPETIELLAAHSLILYVKATADDEEQLLRRVKDDRRPLCYRNEFLEEQLERYMREEGLEYVALIDPDDLYGWMLPRLYESRVARYERIASQYGYTVTAAEIAAVTCEQDFVDLVAGVIERTP